MKTYNIYHGGLDETTLKVVDVDVFFITWSKLKKFNLGQNYII